MNPQAKAGGGKVRKVMHEFRSGSLKSSSGQKVTNPKQAMAIALSEQRRVKHMQVGGLARGGHLSPDVRFDKFIGSDRTMGADYVKAERKQARLASGAGGAGAKVNIPNTRHGKIDMPYHSLKRMTGMRKGGKVRRFEEGGDTGSRFDEDTLSRARAWMKSQTEGGVGEAPESKPSSAPARRAAAPAPKPVTDYGDESARMLARSPRPATSTPVPRSEPTGSMRATPTGETHQGAVTGRAKPRKLLDTDSPEYEAARQKVMDYGIVPLTTIGAGGAGLRAGVRATSAATEAAEAAAAKAFDTVAKGTKKRAYEHAYNARRRTERATERARREADAKGLEAFGERGAPLIFGKGGKVKEAQMEMRHAKAMKKAGLPKSMVREEMAEAKKYARGGGIESRGKTKGTVIKMAGGGHVRGGGCEQRGKTKGKMV